MGLAESRFARLIAWRVMGSHPGLKPIPPISRLSSSIIRVLGCNPGPMTLQGTNTYLVGTGSKRLLIDTGEKNNAQYLDHLASVLSEERARISHIVLTHWHADHTGGVAGIVTSPHLVDNPQILKIKREKEEEFSSDFPLTFVKHGDLLSVKGAKLRAVYTPGHTDDHMCLFLEDDKTLFCGDCVLGEGTAVFENFGPYMKSLALLKEINPAVIYPAHGSAVENPVSVIQNYIDHRMEREKQILAQLEGAFPNFLSVDKLVSAIYPTLNFILRRGANNNVKQQLEKLVADGKVAKDGESFKLLQPNF